MGQDYIYVWEGLSEGVRKRPDLLGCVARDFFYDRQLSVAAEGAVDG